MARDFRPKSARQGDGAARLKKLDRPIKLKVKSRKEDKESESSSDEDDGNLLQAIESFGGDKSDLSLISKKNGKSKETRDDDKDDVSCVEFFLYD